MSRHSEHGREPLPPSWFEKNVQTIVRGVIAVCGLLIVADVVFHFVGHKHTHFDVEGWIGFYAIVGFVSYVGLVLTAKQLRKLLMRPLDYYGEEVPVGAPHPSSSGASAAAAAQGLAQSRRAAEDAEGEGEEESESDVGSRESDVGSRESDVGSRESESESESDAEAEAEDEEDDGEDDR